MLSPFTWNQFMAAVGTTAALYYLVVLLLFYRDEARRLLKSIHNRTNLPADQPLPPQVSIMGPASSEQAPLLSDPAAVLVAPSSNMNPDTEDTLLQNFREEVTSLLEMTGESKTGKDDFLSLLGLVMARYAPHLKPLHRDTAEQFLLDQGQEHLPFQLAPGDLASLWPEDSSAH